MSKTFSLGITAVAVAFSAVLALAGPPDKVLISILNIEHTKPPVGFNHQMHWEKITDCRICHHRDGGIVGQKCSGCHGATDEITRISQRQAYHKLCIGCHSRERVGPRKCPQCHNEELSVTYQAGR